MKNSNNTGGGVGFIGLLTIVFIVLKLVGVIHWSWVWILAPVWGSFLILIGVFAIIFIIEEY